MERVIDENLRRILRFDDSFKAELFEVTTNKGISYVCVAFEQRLANGGIREFRTDLTRLAHIDRRVEEYTRAATRAEHFEKDADIELRLKSIQPDGFWDDVRVSLIQPDRFGSGELERCDLDGRDLKAVVMEGNKLAEELGHGRWFVLVANDSLNRDEAGRIHAVAVKSFPTVQKAHDHLDRSGGGLALYVVPQRAELSKGDTLELWPKAEMFLKRQHGPSDVEHQLSLARWDQGRKTPGYFLAKWDDARREPSLNGRVQYEGTGYDAANLKPEEYRAGYVLGRDRGDCGEPKWVLVKEDPSKMGLGNVRAISTDRDALEAKMERLQGIQRAMKTGLERREETQRAVIQDWNQQSFSMERARFR